MAFKIAVLAALTLLYLYEMFVNYLGMRSTNNPIPQNVSDVYDAETYKKWKAYHAEKYRLKMIASSVTFIVNVVLFSANVYAAFASLFPAADFMQMFSVFILFFLLLRFMRYSSLLSGS